MTQPARLTARLERLAAGAGRPIVVVDFLPFSSANRLGQLLCAHRADQPVYQVDPVTDLAACRGYLPLSALADAYADALAAEGLAHRPAILVGYCSAAVLALEITARMAPQGKACAVLVAPTWPDSAMIAAEYCRFRADLGGTGPDLPGCAAEGDDAQYQKMSGQLAEDLQAVAAANDLDASSAVFGDMLARYSAWLAFLIASREATAGWCSPSAPAFPVQILSVDENGEEAAQPMSLHHLVDSMPVPVSELLTSPAIARAILDPRV
jgi:hypothetical protein